MKRLVLDSVKATSAQTFLPFDLRDAIWARLEEHAHVVVLEVRILFWSERWTLRELFPLFVRIIGSPPPAPGLADRTQRR